jgi:hypothetical protein
MRRGSAPFLLIAASVSRTRAARRRGGFVGVDRRLFAARLARPHAKVSAVHRRSAAREAGVVPGPVVARNPLSARGRSRGAGRPAMVLGPQLWNSAAAAAVTEQHEPSTPCRRRGRPLSCCALARALASQDSRTIVRSCHEAPWCSYPSVEGGRAGTGLLGPSVLDIWFLVATGGSVGRPAGACVGASHSDRAARPHDEDGPHSRLACRRSGRATAYPGNRYPLGPNVCASRADPGLPGGVSSRPPSSSTSCGTTS